MRSLILSFLFLVPLAAAAQTNVSGTISTNTTWSSSSSPYVVTGDLTVAAGATLTINSGVVVQAAATDGANTGSSSSRVEFIIDGKLVVNGTSSSPVTFTTLGSNGAWQGIRVNAGALPSTLTYAKVEKAYRAVEVSGTVTLTNTEITASTDWGLYVNNGATATVSLSKFSSSNGAVFVNGGSTSVGTLEMDRTLVTGCGNSGSSVYAIDVRGNATLHHNTVADNNYRGLYLSPASNTVTETVRDNVFSNNGQYGVYRNGTTGTVVFNYNNVWGHTSGNITGATGGTGNIYANPLFVGSGNYRLTSNSPSRKASSDGTDQGALPYVSDTTPTLTGTLHSSVTLNGNQTVTGDLTVAPGVTLTLAAGTTLTFATSDLSGSGTSTTRTELIVDGKLVVNGTASSPVTLTTTGSAGAWQGVRILSGSTQSTLNYVRIEKAYRGLEVNGTVGLTNSQIATATERCVYVNNGGTANLSGNQLSNCQGGAVFLNGGTSSSGTLNMDTTLVTSSGDTSSSVYAVDLRGNATLSRVTLADNIYRGLYLSPAHSSLTQTVQDSVLSSNGQYGVYRNGTTGTVVCNYNNVWGHTSGNMTGIGGDTGNISANPLFVGGGNYRLTSNSPSRKSASNGADQGALPYTGDATPSLVGTLYTNQTLSGAQTVTGDLTVAPGVTLTLGAGATLNFATTDLMSSGTSSSRAELIVGGTLLVNGTAANPVTLTSSGSAGSWQGVRIMSSSTGSVLNGLVIERPYRGLEVTGTVTLTQSSISAASERCVYVNNGANANLATSVLTNCVGGAVFLNGGSTSVGTLNMETTVVTGSGNSSSNVYGLDLRGNATLHHNTIADNNYRGVYLSPAANAVFQTLRDNVLVNNGQYGVYRNGTTGTVVFNYNNVWGHTSSEYTGISGDTGNFGANPLFVGGGNYRLTANSPSRKASSDGSDQGALPYVNDPTPTLVGTLWNSITLSGPNTVTGDLTVGPEATLTLAPGATLTFAPTDQMKSGTDTNRAELMVRGTLATQGSNGSEATLTTGGNNGDWYGVRVLAGGTANLSYLVITKARLGLVTYGTTTANAITVGPVTDYCVTAESGGTVNLTNSTLYNCNGGAAWASGSSIPGTLNMDFTLVTGSGNSGNSRYALNVQGTATLHHNTIANNNYRGLYLSPTAANIVQTVRDNIIVNNGQYGVYRNGTTGAVLYNHNDSFGHSSGNTTGITGGTGNISADPQFVGVNDYRLQATSPCRGTGTNGSDMGAFPYAVGNVDRIEVTPTNPTVAAGGTQAFSAQAFDAANNPIPATFTWTATSAAGTINASSGLLTASCTTGTVSAGVTASAGGKSGSATVTIVPGPAATMDLAPTTVSVVAGANHTFSATVKDICNNVLPSSVSWTTGAGAGSVTAGGVYTASCTPGSYSNAVTATSGSVSRSATVTVTVGPLAAINLQPQNPSVPAAGQQQFSANGADSCGNSVSATVSWSASGGAGTINSTGLFTASTTPGSYPNAVTATSGAFTKSTTVNVTGGAVSTVTVSPNTITLGSGAKHLFTAVAKDGAGNVVNEPITWSVAAGGGTIAQNGEFTAGNVAGTFSGTVKATASGVSGTASVVVQAGAASKVVITPTSATLAPNGTTTFSAQVFDANNNLTADPVSWAVVTASAGTINAGGMFTAGTSPGNYPNAVTATAAGVTASASVTVNPGALSQLVIAPQTATVRAGGTVAFTASGKDANGNTVPITPSWSVLKGGGSIDSNGVFTASGMPGTFADSVQVSANGLAATASVVVTTGPVVQVSISPGYPALVPKESRQFTAVAKDSFGNEVTGAAFTWTADATAGTVDGQGLFTAGENPGDFPNAVVAEAQGIKGSASVRVLGDAPNNDGGVISDGGSNNPSDGGVETTEDGGFIETDGGVMHLKAEPGCGCTGGPIEGAAFGLLALVLFARRRAERR